MVAADELLVVTVPLNEVIVEDNEELAVVNPDDMVSILPAIEELVLVRETFIEDILLDRDELIFVMDVPTMVIVAASEDDSLEMVPYIELAYAAAEDEF